VTQIKRVVQVISRLRVDPVQQVETSSLSSNRPGR